MNRQAIHVLIPVLPKAELQIHIEGTLEPELMFEMAERDRSNARRALRVDRARWLIGDHAVCCELAPRTCSDRRSWSALGPRQAENCCVLVVTDE
jgi:hypothetical protein